MNEIVNLESKSVEPAQNEIVDMQSYDVDMLEHQVAQLEKKIELSNRVKQVVCKCTTLNDWADMGGKPYLQCHGAEKIAAIFGIGWNEPQYSEETLPDGHFIYTCTMQIKYNNRSISSLGTRSSNTPFFSRKRGQNVPPELIDKTNIKKAAYTNCLGNGIKRILGIRDLTWDEINGVQKIGKAGKVTYGNKQAPSKAVSAPSAEDPNIISKAQVDYARSLCHQIGFKGNQLNEFLHKHAVSVTADKIAQMPRAEAKVFIEKLISLKEGEIV